MSAPLRAILAASVFAVLLPVAACDAGSGVACCPIDEPSCNCPQSGGSPDAFGQCRSGPCDARPSAFVRYIDENGCPAYRVSSSASCRTGSGRYDAGQDAQPDAPGDARDGSSDAQTDAAPDASDADASTDAGAP